MALADELGARLGAGALVSLGPLDADPSALWPEERGLATRAIPKRQRELATGRREARRLLGALGFPPSALLAGPDRGPLWPAGAVGSISHCDHLCAVAVARAEQHASLGLDLEEDGRLKESLWAMVLREAERAFVRAQPPATQASVATIFFSAKECLYKCQHPLTRQMLDFQEVELGLDLAAGRFFATILHAAVPFGKAEPIEGFFIRAEGHVLSGMQLPAGFGQPVTRP